MTYLSGKKNFAKQRLLFLFALFGFVEAAKFRDLGEFSDCVQNVGGKVTKKILHGVKRLGKQPGSFLVPPVLGAGWERGLERKCYAM